MGMTRKYWKGLDELRETPEFLKSKEQEFPTHQSVDEFLGDEQLGETSTGRRDFLKFLGFSVAAPPYTPQNFMNTPHGSSLQTPPCFIPPNNPQTPPYAHCKNLHRKSPC